MYFLFCSSCKKIDSCALKLCIDLFTVAVCLSEICGYRGWGELKVWFSFLGKHPVDGNNLNKESAPLLGPLWCAFRRALIIELILLSTIQVNLKAILLLLRTSELVLVLFTPHKFLLRTCFLWRNTWITLKMHCFNDSPAVLLFRSLKLLALLFLPEFGLLCKMHYHLFVCLLIWCLIKTYLVLLFLY